MASDIVERLRVPQSWELDDDALGLRLEAADEIAALRARVRHLTEPLPDDPGGRMWSTLNYLASLEGDDLETEVAHWASKSITHLRARVAELEAALWPFAAFAAKLSPETADDAVPDIEWGDGQASCLCCEVTAGDVRAARRALEPADGR